MARPIVKDPKRPFSCQLKDSDIRWLKQTADEREMTINSLVELGLICVRAQLLPVVKSLSPAKKPIVSEVKHLGLYVPTGSDS